MRRWQHYVAPIALAGIVAGGIYASLGGGYVARPGSLTPAPSSGRYYYAPNGVTTGTSSALGVGTLRVLPWDISGPVTIANIGADVTSAGDAGSKVRLCVYADDGTGRPGALELDAGQIAGDSAAVQEITGIATTIGAGRHYLGGVVQSVATTQPTMRTIASLFSQVDIGTSAPSTGTATIGFAQSGVTGACPDPFGTPSATLTSSPRIFIKVQ